MNQDGGASSEPHDISIKTAGREAEHQPSSATYYDRKIDIMLLGGFSDSGEWTGECAINFESVSEKLQSAFSLSLPAVGLAILERPPTDVKISERAVPSSCTFWREAEAGLFFAPASAHYNCPIGAMVMGFDLPESVSSDLTALVGMMTKCGYIGEDEPASIPKAPKSGAGVLYGPLAAFPSEPDVVLLWVTPQQAMMMGETLGSACWNETAPTTAFGRPACAAIPMSMTEGRSVMSLGCIGMRTFTDIPSDQMLVVVPGKDLLALEGAIASTQSANAQMSQFYDEHKKRFERAISS